VPAPHVEDGEIGIGVNDLGKAGVDSHEFAKKVSEVGHLLRTSIPLPSEAEDLALGNGRDEWTFRPHCQRMLALDPSSGGVLPGKMDQHAGIQQDQGGR
jgi:hypothetical protein